MSVLCVIPARIASTRLPKKPLLMIGDKPLIQHTYEAAVSCKAITRVVVATDSEDVAEVVRGLGGDAVVSDVPFETGSDRVAAVAQAYPEMEVVINLQGDEPFVEPFMLETLVAPFNTHSDVQMSTVAYPLAPENHALPEVVKVLVDYQGNALYFSRAAIPHYRQQQVDGVPVYHHMGLYAFRHAFLQEYTQLPQTALERAESLEQLRALEHGIRVHVGVLPYGSEVEVNTPEDLARAREKVEKRAN